MANYGWITEAGGGRRWGDIGNGPAGTGGAPFQTPQQQYQTQQAQTISTNAAAAADPFAGQRAQYQGQLQGLMNGPEQGQVGGDIQNMRNTASQPMGGPYMGMLEKLMTDKNSITQTPGSQYAMEQGQNALGRSQASKGFLGSGNILSALQTQAQGEAAQDYSRQLADTRAAAGLSTQNQQSQFGMQQGVAGASGQNMQNEYSRLALLSGAQTGSPSAAGGLLAKQFDWEHQNIPGQGGGAGMMSQSGSNNGGVFRGYNGALYSDTPAGHMQSDSAMQNWGKTSGLEAPVGGSMPQGGYNGSAGSNVGGSFRPSSMQSMGMF
jgi:hypothetical protein